MKSSDYWKKRSEQIAARQFDKADKYEAELKREFYLATSDIQRSIEVFYHRYAMNDEISLAEAKKQLSGRELREFKMTLEEFTAKAKDNADGRWTQLLNNVYYRTRVSRLEALQLQIQHHAEMLAGSRQKGTGSLLGDVYEDTYYRTLYELQSGTGVGASFARINADGLQKILGTEFAGSNWSKRIWGDRDKLAAELRTKLAQSFIRGDSAERMIREVTERFDVSRSNAERLIQTETAFFVGQATMDGYKASGVVDRYELLATLDSRTTPICRSLDGKVFPLSEMDVGVNYPPLHARCRTTTIPYFDDEVDPGERIAKDENGDIYFVPGNITYPEWKKRYVDNRANSSGNGVGGSHTPFQSVKEAEDFARDHLGFSQVDYTGMDLVSATSINQSIAKVMTRYPKIKGFAQSIEAVNDPDFVAQATLSYENGQLISTLKVSKHYYNSNDIHGIINQSVAAKHWPKGSNPESIFIHEFGHLLEYAHAVKSFQAWTGQPIDVNDVRQISLILNSEKLSGEIKNETLTNLGIQDTPDNIRNELSGYAVTSSMEFLAEAFAEAEGTEKPRRVAAEAIRILREKLKGVGLL